MTEKHYQLTDKTNMSKKKLLQHIIRFENFTLQAKAKLELHKDAHEQLIKELTTYELEVDSAIYALNKLQNLH